MTFRSDSIDDFRALFEEKKNLIRRTKGCQHLELLEDINSPTTLFTLSWWEDESHLEDYRNSGLFSETWKQTKAFFGDKPQAWSLNAISKVASERKK